GTNRSVTTLAGLARNPGSTDGTGSAVRFHGPFGVAVDSVRNIYVADTYDHTIRKGWPASPKTLFGISRQVNVNSNGNNIPGDAANEPSLCIDPNNPNHLAIGWRQFDNIASDFRQAGWAYSTDSGLTWIFPGSLEPGVFR